MGISNKNYTLEGGRGPGRGRFEIFLIINLIQNLLQKDILSQNSKKDYILTSLGRGVQYIAVGVSNWWSAGGLSS